MKVHYAHWLVASITTRQPRAGKPHDIIRESEILPSINIKSVQHKHLSCSLFLSSTRFRVLVEKTRSKKYTHKKKKKKKKRKRRNRVRKGIQKSGLLSFLINSPTNFYHLIEISNSYNGHCGFITKLFFFSVVDVASGLKKFIACTSSVIPVSIHATRRKKRKIISWKYTHTCRDKHKSVSVRLGGRHIVLCLSLDSRVLTFEHACVFAVIFTRQYATVNLKGISFFGLTCGRSFVTAID